ncbi:MAG: RluA family pseudouridine synthase [Peptococcaceae bacterium]|nr:RluA family pseudouridine synthase [Peptococcaceae bacterium]
MNAEQIHIPATAAGERLDKWVSDNSTYSRSAFKRLVEEGNVHFDGETIKKSGFKIPHAGVLTLSHSMQAIDPIQMPLDIVYEDEYLLIVNKPRGLLVYPVKDPSEPSLAAGLLAHCPLSTYAGEERPGIVHRIDRGTSGLLLVAKNNSVHEKLYQMLKVHDISRQYIGIVTRPMAVKRGTVDAAIAHDYTHGTKRIIDPLGGQPAVTHYACVYQNQAYALMRFALETGRTHQIRVHMASIGHPLVGDGLYGEEKNIFGFHGQALHALRLEFIHPITGQSIHAVGRPPDIFKKAVKRIQMMK